MDSMSQQATPITKGGGPAKPHADTEIKAESPDTLNAADSSRTSKEAAKPQDRKGKSAKKQANGTKLGKNKKNKKKKKHVATDDSSDSSDDDPALSDSVSEDSDLEVVVSRKFATKKGDNAPKLKMGKKKKHKQPAKRKSQPPAASDTDSASSDSDSESSSDEAEDAEPVVGQKKTKDHGLKQDLGYHVARELQRILQLAQVPPSASSISGNVAYGTGLDAGLGAGLAGASFSRPQVLSSLQPSYPSALGSRARPGRAAGLPQGGVQDTLNERLALLDGLGDPLGRDTGLSVIAGRGARRGLSQVDKKQPGDPANPTSQKAKKPNYKRVDQVWDNAIHNFKLQDTTESATEKQYSGFCFHVRRTFDWEGKYKATVVDIKSKALRECLQDVMGNIKGVSLVDETPKLDPNMLFLYLEDLRKHAKQLKKQAASPSGSDKAARRKEAKRLEEMRQHLKVLIKYIDKDYEHIKNSLDPMLEHGLITFDLLWALWKPSTLAYTTTYGSHDEPRVFKVETAEKHYHLSKGEFYFIDGKVGILRLVT